MSSDIISWIELDNLDTSKVIVTKEINGCDSAFVISCVLGHCIKNKLATLVISLHNFCSHYQNVGLKMNYNLQKEIEIGLIKYCNVGEHQVNALLSNNESTIDGLIIMIKDLILQMKNTHGCVNVIFEGFSHLFNLQYNFKDINKLSNEIIKIVRETNKAFVLFQCNVANDEDVTHTMANLLCHKAQTVLEVKSLTSGWSADVSGHLTVKHIGRNFEDDHMHVMNTKPSQHLFKLFDRGVKLFAPGTV